jgi:membrane protein
MLEKIKKFLSKLTVDTIKITISRHPLYVKLIELLRRIVLPGFDGMPIFDVLVFFIKGLIKGELSRRAASLSYNFFMALFPLVLFLFTIIAYLPIDNFVPLTYEMIESFLPEQSISFVKETIDGILKKNGTLLSFSILFTFYFATRGTTALISELNASYHDIETRGFIKQKLVSLFMLFMLLLMFLISLGINIAVSQFLTLVSEYDIIRIPWHFTAIRIVKWLIILFLVFMCISLIYYFAPARKREYHFISAGSTLATLLVALSSVGFNYYVTNFSSYNAVYGSIGALIILMIWIQLLSMILLIGFELNVSIHHAGRKHVKT